VREGEKEEHGGGWGTCSGSKWKFGGKIGTAGGIWKSKEGVTFLFLLNSNVGPSRKNTR